MRSKSWRREAPLHALMLVALMLLWAPPASAGNSPSVVTLTDDGTVPRTDGVTAVWVAHAPGNPALGAIYGALVDVGAPFAIAPSAADQQYPDIADGIVVWAEADTRSPCDACPYDIRGKDLASGALLDIATTTDDENVPVISGNWVAWVQLDDQNVQTIRARDISTMAEPIVVATVEAASLSRPALDGDRLVWSETRTTGQEQSFTGRLYTARIGEEPVLLAENADFDIGAYDVAGDIIVYGDAVSSSVNETIHVRDLARGTDDTLPTRGVAPVTDGRYVFWQTDAFGPASALSGWDRMTQSWWTAAAWPALQPALGVGGGALVWQTEQDDSEQNIVQYAVTSARIADLLPSGRQSAPDDTTAVAWFPSTGHTLAGDFGHFWDANGGLPVFGYPLTEPFSAQPADDGAVQTVQYLERQRFEDHPELHGTPYAVLLGRLGAELLATQGRDWMSFPQADPSAPHYVAATGHAIAPEFVAYWSTHGLEMGDAGVSYRESLALFGYPLSEPMSETNADGDTVLTQYFERAVFEYHPENAGTPYAVLLRRVGAEALAARGWTP